jgi:hypothetical protein
MQDPARLQDIEKIIQNFLSMAIRLAGVALFIMIIIGGFKYLTAGDNPKAAESARNTMTYAILGLVMVIGAWFILKFIATFTGVTNILEFAIPKYL